MLEFFGDRHYGWGKFITWAALTTSGSTWRAECETLANECKWVKAGADEIIILVLVLSRLYHLFPAKGPESSHPSAPTPNLDGWLRRSKKEDGANCMFFSTSHIWEPVTSPHCLLVMLPCALIRLLRSSISGRQNWPNSFLKEMSRNISIFKN